MTRPISTLANFSAMICLAAVLGGCAFGRTYSYADTPVALQGVSSTGPVAVGVKDDRAYVSSGAKPEKFVGLMRGGFGNPFDVNTQSGGPLAVEMRDAIVKSLRGKGITVSPVMISHSDTASNAKRAMLAAKARRIVLVTLNEWKSDTMMNTTLYYDATLQVMDENGAVLATNQAKGNDNLGSLGLSPSAGISTAFVRKFDALFDDEKIIAALK